MTDGGAAGPSCGVPHAVVGAVDAVAESLEEVDALAGLVHACVADEPGGGDVWVVSHWIDHDPAVGGAHLAVSVAAGATFATDATDATGNDGDPGGLGGLGPDGLWRALTRAGACWAADSRVAARPGEIGVAVGARVAGLRGLAAAAARCQTRHARRASGRAIVFPGSERITGALTVAELIGSTAIEEVVGLADTRVADDVLVHTFGYARPVFRRGRLVLPVVPFGSGHVTPYEVRNPTRCCADH